jgi:hypothetical protein
MKETIKPILGQVIYVGPHIQKEGLQRGAIFRNGIFPQLYNLIAACPAIGELFLPIADYAKVRRELNFDIARNMRGTTGKYVAFYREAEQWLAERNKQTKQPSTGVTIQHHA